MNFTILKIAIHKKDVFFDSNLTENGILTLQPIASSECKIKMVSRVAAAVSLVWSRTTGRKVKTNTDPETTVDTRIKSQRSHSNGMIHRSCIVEEYNIVGYTHQWKSIQPPSYSTGTYCIRNCMQSYKQLYYSSYPDE